MNHCVAFNRSTGQRFEPTALWRRRGVTMIEMMVVVAIMAILLGLAVPYMQEFYIANRLGANSNEFLAALGDARNEAMRRGVPVTMRSTAGSRNWGSGWTVCIDSSATAPAGTCASGATDIIRRGMPLPAPLTMYSNATFTAAVTFDAGGRVVNTGANPTGPTYPGIFVLCHDGAFAHGGRPRSRAILINAVGRIRPGLDATADGIPEGDGAANITGDCTNPTNPTP